MAYILIENCYDCPFRHTYELHDDECLHPESEVTPFDMSRIWRDDLKKTHLPEKCPFLNGSFEFAINDNLQIQKAFDYGEINK